MIWILDAQEYIAHRNLNVRDWTGVRTLMGDALSGIVPPTTLEITDANATDSKSLPDYFESTMPVVSDRLRRLFESVGVDAEYLPVNVECKYRRAPIQRYWLFNVRSVLDCLDEENSIIRRSVPLGGIEVIERLTLRFDAGARCPIFRVKKLEWIVFISDSAKLVMEKADVSGLRFTHLSKFVFPRYPSPEEYES